MVTDDILYRRYLGGDEDSLSALMERHGDKLTLYLDGCLHDLHESEDLMIEAFAYLIAKQPRIRDGGFRAYLYRSARHMALRLLSGKRAQLCFSPDALTVGALPADVPLEQFNSATLSSPVCVTLPSLMGFGGCSPPRPHADLSAYSHDGAMVAP